MVVPWGVVELRLQNFRCFAQAELHPSRLNLIEGGNASGKTSLLEALFVLGRGTSFRAARTDALIREGEAAAILYAAVGRPGGAVDKVGVEVSRHGGTTPRVNGATGTRATLAAALPVQLLDPASHQLVQGPPAVRRRFLDWGVFHVEPLFLDAWQRFRRALQQRNAALKEGRGEPAWAWDEALAEAGTQIAECRQRALAGLAPRAGELATAFTGEELSLRYVLGWPAELPLADALRAGRDRDLHLGSTQAGPHRADLRIELRARRARESVSRGQEKLVAAALTLAQVEAVSASRSGEAVLLVDEPGADLDRRHLARLLEAVWASPAQVFLTTLDSSQVPPPPGGRLFHVEHAEVRPLL